MLKYSFFSYNNKKTFVINVIKFKMINLSSNLFNIFSLYGLQFVTKFSSKINVKNKNKFDSEGKLN
jgi:hypothetical protein